MATVLIVIAHPLDSQKSYALKGLEYVKQVYSNLHPEDTIEVLHIFDEGIPSLDKPLLEAMSAAKKGDVVDEKQAERLARYGELTQQFLRSDKLIIANPLWNLNVPSQLVDWINTICVAGVTFKYGSEGSIGLAKRKKVLHIQSNGGVYEGKDPAARYIRSVFEFLGVEEIFQVFIEGQSANLAQSEAIFNQSLARLDRILELF